MDCRSCEKHINEYLDGDLSKREEKKFQKHLAKCPTCKNEFDEYMFMNDQLAGIEELSPSEGFEARVLSQLQPYEAYEKSYTQDAYEKRYTQDAYEKRHTQDAYEKSYAEDAYEKRYTKDAYEGKYTQNVAGSQKVPGSSKVRRVNTEKLTEEVQQRDKLKDVIMILGYFITLFVVLSVLRNAVFQNTRWISGIMVTGRVFREVFDGLIFRGVLSLLVVYPIRIFHWARVNFSQMSLEGRMMYSLVVMNLILVITFSQIMLRKLAKGRGKNKGGSSDEMQHSRT